MIKPMERFLQDFPIKTINVSVEHCPSALYYRGNFLTNNEKCFAIVGTRLASDYGKEIAFSVAKDLSAAGLTVVSGMALGIDTFAHQGALEANGKTIAVLGTGLDEQAIYPQENLKLAKQILEKNGCLISEYPPSARATAFTFPQRNRIIAGLSLGVLVVEAKIKSGALITAAFAKKYNRKVFAVPGNIHSQNSKGCHQLIKQGANLVENANDILKHLALPEIKTKQQIASDPNQQLIFNALQNGPLHIDQIIEQTKKPISEISGLITVMEIENKIRNLGNNVFSLNS